MIHIVNYTSEEKPILYLPRTYLTIENFDSTENKLDIHFNINMFEHDGTNRNETRDNSYYINDCVEYICLSKLKFSSQDIFLFSSMAQNKNENLELLQEQKNKIISKYKNYFLLYQATNNDLYIISDIFYASINEDNFTSDEYDITNIAFDAENTPTNIEYLKSVLSDEEYLRFYKQFYIDKILANEFQSNMCNYVTPIGSYLDLQSDFLMKYIKFLYDRKDSVLLEFLKNNEKYETIFNMSIAYGSDTTENKEQSTIENSFATKRKIQDHIIDYKNKIKQVEEATSISDFPPEKYVIENRD